MRVWDLWVGVEGEEGGEALRLKLHVVGKWVSGCALSVLTR